MKNIGLTINQIKKHLKYDSNLIRLKNKENAIHYNQFE